MSDDIAEEGSSQQKLYFYATTFLAAICALGLVFVGMIGK